MLRLHDTASGRPMDVVQPGATSMSMYVCGPTVYGPPHIGHGRQTLVYDVIRRYLEYRGVSVHHVSNVTDIDDKIITLAQQTSRPWQEIVETAEALWWSAMDHLGAKRPTEIPHATEFIGEMTDLIVELVLRNVAYETSDGVYLSVAAVPDYGLLGGQRAEDRRAGARIEVDDDKHAPADFALWKKAKPNEPTWPSPFGDGRPGWHTECVVMSLKLLGEGFDLHGGGLDLLFPHHENERAQAVAAGRRFTRVWAQNGLATASGEKMSKSLGNTKSLAELMAEVDPRSYRLLVCRAHYRAPLEVTEDLLTDAGAALGRVDALARRDGGGEAGSTPESDAVRQRFIDAMDDDLDTPRALAGAFEALRDANSLLDRGASAEGAALRRVVLELFGALGVTTSATEALPAEIVALGQARDAARAARNYGQSDAIRAQLEQLGYRVEDGPNGTRIWR